MLLSILKSFTTQPNHSHEIKFSFQKASEYDHTRNRGGGQIRTKTVKKEKNHNCSKIQGNIITKTFLNVVEDVNISKQNKQLSVS